GAARALRRSRRSAAARERPPPGSALRRQPGRTGDRGAVGLKADRYSCPVDSRQCIAGRSPPQSPIVERCGWTRGKFVENRRAIASACPPVPADCRTKLERGGRRAASPAPPRRQPPRRERRVRGRNDSRANALVG